MWCWFVHSRSCESSNVDDYADPVNPYMFHCHILEHEDVGMMGQFVVEE